MPREKKLSTESSPLKFYEEKNREFIRNIKRYEKLKKLQDGFTLEQKNAIKKLLGI